MLIAQISDLHVGYHDPADPEEPNQQRLRAVLARLIDGPNRPDLLVASGDLADLDKPDSSMKVAELLSACPFPVHAMAGNHDTREGLLAAFPQTPTDDGFLHYALDLGGLRLLLLDTSEPGRHGGEFCARRQAWLTAELDRQPEVPTVIFMHHPPIAVGIEWMDPPSDAGWIGRFGECVEGRGQLLAIHCGHLHRQIGGRFRNIPVGVTPSVAPPVALDLNPIDPEDADGRSLITDELPGYALHRWDGAALVTHYEQVGGWRAIASFGEAHRGMIRSLLADHRQD